MNDHAHHADTGITAHAEPLNLAAIRERLSAATGPEYWRSLEEVAETPAFQEFLHREFPQQASEFTDPVGRRDFLKLMSASLALAGISACTRQPTEKIVPYVRAPEEFVPGIPLYYATAMPLGGYATGLLVESHEGRPTKVEGNPQHPASLGATDAFSQASILSLYDPDRSQVITRAGSISTWGTFLGQLREKLGDQARVRLRILTETVTSPTLAGQIQSILKAFPAARWYQYEPVSGDNIRAGAKLAFGSPVTTHYRFAEADVVLALDANFMAQGPSSVRDAREFTSRRKLVGGQRSMNRLYCIESSPTPTGSIADHRLPVRASAIGSLARAIAAALGVSQGRQEAALSGPQARWVEAVAADLKAHPGRSVVIAGLQQPPEVHALAHAMNAALGNEGKTVVHTEPVEASPVSQFAGIRELAEEMRAGKVDALIILGGNPVYAAPADVEFARAMDTVPFRVHLGMYNDETAELCHWHIPESHYLEAWGDARAFDGTVTIMQPLIAPLYATKSACELLAAIAGKADASGYDIVREYWRAQRAGDGFEAFWRRCLHDGIVDGTALPAARVTLQANVAEASANQAEASGSGLELVFAPDPSIWDGRFANNGWLQELPKPGSKLTWDNAVLVSPRTAERLALSNEDLVELSLGGRKVQGPVFILPGQADESITVYLGYGRRRTGRVGTGTGFDAGLLRTSDAPWFSTGLEIRPLGRRYKLAATQQHFTLEGRNIVRSATLEQFTKDPEFAHHIGHEPPKSLSLYPEYEYDGYAWGMAINQNACIGCNACVVACQAENNIPVVGKQQVMMNREMHWLRIDRYYKGGLDNPETYHQPMLCQHCEKAPCEVVCPVAATVHSPEGLNDMVYNRCVGTRYCANNCPYKVRRFNFLLYSDWNTDSLKAMRNPDVSVRSRGVMEKCTFCVQRINAARIEAEKEDRQIRDGEVVTACQGACPTQAIVFGNINDPNSAVSKLKREPLNYGVLADLNTQPRTTYLANVRNPNPALVETGSDHSGDSAHHA